MPDRPLLTLPHCRRREGDVPKTVVPVLAELSDTIEHCFRAAFIGLPHPGLADFEDARASVRRME